MNRQSVQFALCLEFVLPLPGPDWRRESDGRAIDPLGCIWIPECFGVKGGADYHWQWSLYVPWFHNDGRAGVGREEPSGCLYCPMVDGAIILPDGRRVEEGGWYH